MSKTNYDDAVKQSVEYFNGDDLAASVYIDKYAISVDGDYIEPTPDKMHKRMSKEFARIEEYFGGQGKLSDDTIYSMFDRFKYIVPAGSVMSGLGNENYRGSLSNCFVIGSPTDSYGSIMKYREYQIQLMKRRGGCIEENTTIITKERGVLPIKEVNVGEHVLSFNVISGKDEWRRVTDKYPTIVDLNDQIELRYSNGVRLKTSTIHPVLKIDKNGYSYSNADSGELSDSWNKSPNLKKYVYNAPTDADVAWFIGCHMGDGTCDNRKGQYRFRIVGNNKSVIDNYKSVINKITGHDSGIVSLCKRYNTEVWEFATSNKSNGIVVEKYIDNQINSKTYTWKVPTYIKDNDLWVPFLAGLIDSDGYITKSGRIDISICSKNAIDDICKFLSYNGISYSVKEKTTKRINEKNIFNLHIHKENDIYLDILGYIKHDIKKENMLSASTIHQSNRYIFTDAEIDAILSIGYQEYTKDRKVYNLFTKNKQNLKDSRLGGKALLHTLLDNNLISSDVYNNICSRTKLTDIVKDNIQKFNYIDIEVEGNNNYYAGELGFVNIHNCGVDISNLRPSGAFVNNAAKSSTGPISFMEVNSELTKEVAQGGRRGALMISMSCVHPDIDEFVIKKQDLTKVNGANISVQFTDEFMKAVEEDGLFLQHYPIDLDVTNIDTTNFNLNEKVWDGKKCYKLIKARELWDSFVHCSWNTAEPGIMFCDKHWDLSPDSVYPEYKGITTNPCVVGDTMVAVADGRGYVSIKTLAEENKDVPVYCLDENNNLTISLMRNPRYTGHKQICKLTLENGHEIKCTLNHKLLVNSVGYVEAKDLNVGDSLFMLSKNQCNWEDIYKENKNKRKGTDYYFLSTSKNEGLKPEHRYVYNYYKNDNPQVIHHNNFKGLDNNIDNLFGMTSFEHNFYHSDRIKGENNPIFKIKSDNEKYLKYSKKMSESTKGENNGNYNDITNEELLNHGIYLTKLNNRMFSQKEWIEYAKNNNLPTLSNYRKSFFGSYKDFSTKCAELCNIEYPNVDVRMYKFYLKIKEFEKTAFIKDGEIYIKRICEMCGKEYDILYNRREQSFCSIECSLAYINGIDGMPKYREQKPFNFFENKLNIIKDKQVELYRSMHENSDIILLKDFQIKCKEVGLSCRFGTKYGFKSYNELRAVANNYNHKIINIEYLDSEDVYNGTVDKYHNFFIGKFEENSVFGKPVYLSVNNKQCGEIFMGKYDSCRLMHINLSSFVENPFTSDAKIDENGLYNAAYCNMKLGDDLVELELEHVNDIIEHIKSTYNEDCANELELWKRVYETGKSSRRAGCGITGLGDVLAMLGLGMGTNEGLAVIDKIAKIKMVAEIQAQVDLARERGTFIGYDFNKEFGYDTETKKYYGKNGFFQRILDMGIPEQLLEDMKKYGRRNVSWSTLAPVGSVSIMAQTTSGIEPLFSSFYKRRKKCSDANDRVDFIDGTGEKFTEFYVVHPKFKEWIIKYSGEYNPELGFDEQTNDDKLNALFEKSPWFGSTASELTAENHVMAQAVFQYYTTHSISKTINLPKSATESIVSDLFIKAWKLSLKGLTIYRDGCRDGILYKEDKECDCKSSLTHSSPKRPKTLHCEIKRFRNGGEKWIAAVGLYGSKPYEIFTGLSEKLLIPEYVKDAEIVKNYIIKQVLDDDGVEFIDKRVSRYDIKYLDNDNKYQIVEGISNVFNPEFYNYSKLISGLLRHGMPIEYILSTVKSLDFKIDSINSWKNGVIRALKSYVVDGVTKELCSKCGSPLHREGGCLICKNCGDSKCG